MGQVNAAVAIKPIKALHHIIRLTRALLVAFAREWKGSAWLSEAKRGL